MQRVPRAHVLVPALLPQKRRLEFAALADDLHQPRGNPTRDVHTAGGQTLEREVTSLRAQDLEEHVHRLDAQLAGAVQRGVRHARGVQVRLGLHAPVNPQEIVDALDTRPAAHLLNLALPERRLAERLERALGLTPRCEVRVGSLGRHDVVRGPVVKEHRFPEAGAGSEHGDGPGG